MSPTVIADVTAPPRCDWCLDALASPYLRRHDGTCLHVGCARLQARAASAPAH